MVPTPQILALAAICLTSQAASFDLPVFASHDVLSRDTLSCTNATSTPCGGGLPGNFCCRENTICTVLANQTTGICCPKGEDCRALGPISCDIQQQNITAHADTVLMTTSLTSSLPKCGSKCCPFGYSCVNDACIVNSNQNGPSSSATSTASPTSVVILPSSTSSTIPAAVSSTSVTGCPLQACQQFPTSAVLVGFFPGIVLGAILAIGSVCLIGARRARKEAQSPSSPFGRVQASISDPIYNGAHNSIIQRSFSLRKGPASVSTGPKTPTPPRAAERVRSLFLAGRRSQQATIVQLDDSPRPSMRSRTDIPPVPRVPSDKHKFAKSSPYNPANLPRPSGEMTEVPITPRLQREPSSEEINIFADPSTVERNGRDASKGLGVSGWDERRGTTFTDLMDRADLSSVRQGKGYVETPPRATGTMPSSRGNFV